MGKPATPHHRKHCQLFLGPHHNKTFSSAVEMLGWLVPVAIN